MKINIWIFVLLFLITGCGHQPAEKSGPSDQWVAGYDEPVRGVWLTNVASDALFSDENIDEAVAYCDSLGMNTIFVVTWNKGMTTYPSQVMKELTGVEMDPALDPENTGRDPLKKVIEEAHQRDMKVFAWFEFGFSSSYQNQGGKILQAKPEWALKDADGNLTTKNGFEWMNPLDPEVQDFILSLIREVIRNYDVDGIQGDDRLPAMPSEGGYNQEIVEQYKDDHFGQAPPQYTKDFEWVHWRAEKLTQFMKRLYREVKEVDSTCIVSMSPSVYPWSKAEYLQDWPVWVNFGYVDMICPQIYRKDSASYSQTLKATREYIRPEKRHLFYPGVLIKVGDYSPSKDFFNYMLQQNRRFGCNGEVYFFFEGLNKYEAELKQTYKK